MRFFPTYLAGFSDNKLKVAELVETSDDRELALLHDTARLGDATVERDLAHISSNVTSRISGRWTAAPRSAYKP